MSSTASSTFGSLAIVALSTSLLACIVVPADDDGSGGGGAGGDAGGSSVSTGGSGGGGASSASTGSGGPISGIAYCGADESSPQCNPNLDPGKVGEGGQFIPFGQTSADIRAGWVDPSGSFMYLLVGDLSINNQSPSESTVWRVELPSGKHTVLSGIEINNPADKLPDQTFITRGAGPSLGKAWGIDMGPDKKLYVHGQSGLFRVDPQSGDREPVTDYGFLPTAACPGLPSTSGPGSRLAIGGTAEVPIAYVGFGKTTGAGLYQFTLGTPVTCDIASSVGKGADVPTVGAGPAWDDDNAPEELTRVGDKLFASQFVDAAYWEVDTKGGNRSVVSKINDPDKRGEGCFHYGRMAVGSDKIWTTGMIHSSCNAPSGARNLSFIDRATGNRELVTNTRGPMGDLPGALWVHPTLPNTLIIEDNEGILFYDHKLGDSVYIAR